MPVLNRALPPIEFSEDTKLPPCLLTVLEKMFELRAYAEVMAACIEYLAQGDNGSSPGLRLLFAEACLQVGGAASAQNAFDQFTEVALEAYLRSPRGQAFGLTQAHHELKKAYAAYLTPEGGQRALEIFFYEQARG
jgi:hypothetical protein